MNQIDAVKERLKSKRIKMISGNNATSNEDRIKYINHLITRVLISVIIFLGLMILMSLSSEVKTFINDTVLKENISFTKISNI